MECTVADPNKAHAAAASATGYLFQCRYALLKGIEAIPDSPDLEISIEKFDDIAFESDGSPTELIQTKHHMGTAVTLGDASVDLWKTIRIWSKRVASSVETPFQTRFVLVTTAVAPEGIENMSL